MPRYIDADKLKKRMFSYYACVTEDASKSNYTGETLMSYEVADLIEDCIDNAPTVDAKPVVHGEWIDGRPYVNSRWKVCSVCKQTAPEPHGGYNYCPNCGAKMDGGADNA